MDAKDQIIAERLAAAAVELGTAIRCQGLYAEGGGPDGTRYGVRADGELVVVRKKPDDLPFMEHPAWDAEVETLMRVKTKRLRHNFAEARRDVEDAVTDFMLGTNCSWLSIKLEDGGHLHANGSDATVYARTRRRWLPGHYMKPVRHWAIA